ncbi:sugar transferase [Sutcliffiella horikoshii]|uniref:sugar transferase n=1 Tax=Sutcliffiella horikoshii TaxID=79883 RepID=UPI00384BEBB6
MSEYMVRRKNKLIFLCLDLLSIVVAYLLAFYFRFDGFPERNINSFITLLPWILMISVLFLSVYELYNVKRRSNWELLRDIIVANTFIVFITMSFSFLFREFALPRTIIIITFFLTIFLMMAWRIVYLKFTTHKKVEKIILFGNKKDLGKIVVDFKKTIPGQIDINCVDNDKYDELTEELIKEADMIAISQDIPKPFKTKIIYEAVSKSKTVYIIPTAYELLLTRASITSIDDSMVLSVKPFGLSFDQQLIKRFFDIIFSIFSIVLLSPLFILAILLVKFESPSGPIFYGQKRLGKYNKEFTIKKFRTMVVDAEKYTGPILATSDDVRITKSGKFLRMTRIDELPQLFNVLKGDMAIVGPRPEREIFIKEYEEKHEGYQYRNTVKPGITGVAQVMGKYSTSVEDKLRYDLYYIRNYSIWLDFLLLLRTIIVVLDKTKSEGNKKTKKIKRSRMNKKII